MPKLYNLARMTTATTGTGTITLGAAVSPYLTFAQAGVPDATQVAYNVFDPPNCALYFGTYTASGTTLSIDRVLRSSGSGNNTAISLSGNAIIAIDAAAESFPQLGGSFNLTASAATTTVFDSRILTSSRILLLPKTAHAAAQEATAYIQQSNVTGGQFTINHGSNAFTDQTFEYIIFNTQ